MIAAHLRLDRPAPPLPADMGEQLERVLIDLARDPGEAVWRPGWGESSPVKAAVAAQFEVMTEAVHAATRGGMTAQAAHDALTAVDILRGLLVRIAWERAATVLAIFRAAGLRVRVADGRLTLGPKERVTDEHKQMARDWREYLIRLLSER